MRLVAQWFVFVIWWVMVAFVATTPISIPLAVGLSEGFGAAFWTMTGAYAFVLLFWLAVWVGYR